MAKKKKKKGRPSLLDLQKRFLKQQQQEQEELQRHLRKPNPSQRSSSSRRYHNIDAAGSPLPEFIAGDDDDDERKEKKHKLLLGFNSNSDCFKPALLANHSVPFGSDSNVDDEDPDLASKRRKISHGSNQMVIINVNVLLFFSKLKIKDPEICCYFVNKF